MLLHVFSTVFLLGLLFGNTVLGAPNAPVVKTHKVSQISASSSSTAITPETEERIVSYFLKNQCSETLNLVSEAQYDKLQPVVLSVIGYCQPDIRKAEMIFKSAEARSAYDDTILILHARYLSKRSLPQANEVWSRVILVTRNPTIRNMAQDYLEGLKGAEDADEKIIMRDYGYYFEAVGGAGWEQNPLGESISDKGYLDSILYNGTFSGAYQHKASFGLWGINMQLLNIRYLRAHAADYFDLSFQFPFIVKAGLNSEFIIRPYGADRTYGNQRFQTIAGLTLIGSRFYGDYRQYVSSTIYSDWYYRQELKNQAGTHFQFEYGWEKSFLPWSIRAAARIEHVKSDREVDNDNALTIIYSHTDLGLDSTLSYYARNFTASLDVRVIGRQDSDGSSYFNSESNLISKTRRDLNIFVQPLISYSMSSNTKLEVYYRLTRNISNIGSSDYADQNFMDNVVGAQVKAFLTD